jgi:predicted Zn finger-like uncharacterized protein
MKIVCPSCAATYEVPEAAVAAKRTVRCARCGGDWVPGATDAPHATPSAEAAPAPPTRVTPEPTPKPARPPAAEEMADFAPTPAPLDLETLPIVSEVDGPFIALPVVPVASLGATPAQNLAAAIAEEAAAGPSAAVEKPPMTAWIASVALLAILILAAVAFREPVMKAWPASTRLYAVFGLYRP